MLRAWNLVLRRSVLRDFAVGGHADGRFLFLVPWRERTIVGTGYDPDAPSGGVRAFLAGAARAFPWAGIVADDVALVHEGLVPGRRGSRALETRSRLIDHEAAEGVRGLVSLRGVKLTTARAEAAKAVALVLRLLSRPAAPCRTAVTPLAAARPLEGSVATQTLRAVREEMAIHLADVVLRRTNLVHRGTAGGSAPRCGGLGDDVRAGVERR